MAGDLLVAAARAESAAWRAEVAYRRVHGAKRRTTMPVLLRLAGTEALLAAGIIEPPSSRGALENGLSLVAAVWFNEAAHLRREARQQRAGRAG